MQNQQTAVKLSFSSSASLSREIEQIEAVNATGRMQLESLNAQNDQVLAAGDIAADAHDAKKVSLQRSIRRGELRLDDLRAHLTEATAHEAEVENKRKKEEATAAVQAIQKRIDREYREPAEKIAGFLRDLQAVEAAAIAAGVQTVHTLVRTTPDQRIPEMKEEYSVYLDEQGCESEHEWPPGTYLVNPLTGALFTNNHNVKPRQKVNRTRTVPRQFVRGATLWPILEAVKLPGFAIGDKNHW